MQTSRDGKLHMMAAVLYLAVFCVMFVLSLLTPMIADDYNYTFGFANELRITGLRQIWNSMYWHRIALNGRVFAHGWLSLVLMYPRWVFAALNAAVSVFFTWTTKSFLEDRGNRHAVWGAACSWMLLWVCMPGFGQVFFWTAGACNYFWGFALAWFVIWRAEALETSGRGRPFRLALLVMPAFAAGAWSEHISFAMLLALFLLGLLSWKRTAKFPWARFVLLISGAAGYLYLMLAPSSKLFQRLQDAGDPGGVSNLAKLTSLMPGGLLVPALLAAAVLVFILALHRHRNFRKLCRTLFFAMGVVCGAAALAFALRGWQNSGIQGAVSDDFFGFFLLLSIFLFLLASKAGQPNEKDRILFSIILSFSGICGVLLFLFGEYFPVRGFCAPVMMLTLAAVSLAEPEGETSGKKVQTASVCLAAVFSLCFVLGAADIVSVHGQAVVREEVFREAAAGDKRVVTSPYSYQTKYTAQYKNSDLAPDAGWPNGVMADYYEVIRIIVE